MLGPRHQGGREGHRKPKHDDQQEQSPRCEALRQPGACEIGSEGSLEVGRSYTRAQLDPDGQIESCRTLDEREPVSTDFDDRAQGESGGAASGTVDEELSIPAGGDRHFPTRARDDRVVRRDPRTQKLDIPVRGAADRHLAGFEVGVLLLLNPVRPATDEANEYLHGVTST